MKLRDISVRHRLLLNNLIMILVPIMLLVALGSAVFYGLRAHVDWSWKKRSGPGSLRRHVAPLEERGVSVAVIDYGEPV